MFYTTVFGSLYPCHVEVVVSTEDEVQVLNYIYGGLLRIYWGRYHEESDGHSTGQVCWERGSLNFTLLPPRVSLPCRGCSFNRRCSTGFCCKFSIPLIRLESTKSRGSGLLWIYQANKGRNIICFLLYLFYILYVFWFHFILLWFCPWKIFIAISGWYNSNPRSIIGNNKLIIWHFQKFQHNEQLNYFSKNMYSTKYNGQMFKVLQMFSMALDFDF